MKVVYQPWDAWGILPDAVVYPTFKQAYEASTQKLERELFAEGETAESTHEMYWGIQELTLKGE